MKDDLNISETTGMAIESLNHSAQRWTVQCIMELSLGFSEGLLSGPAPQRCKTSKDGKETKNADTDQ